MKNSAAPASDILPPIPPDAPERWALFLDVDGTLVEIAADPDAVVVSPRLVAVLGKLNERLTGAIALVSGRTIARLDTLFAPLRLPAAGTHGLERRGADGRLRRPTARPAELGQARAAFAAFAAAHPGTIVEDKELSVALHYRRAPACEAAALALAERIAGGLAGGFRLQHGKMMVEIRPPGGDKGSVVVAFLAEPPFIGRTPVFIGDDVTDEDGFAVVNRLGGVSVRVGGVEPTAALYRAADVPALLDWLARVATATGGPG